MLRPDVQGALTRAVGRLIDEKKDAAKWLREIAKELEAGVLTAEATLRLASRVRGIEHHLVMGRR